MTRFVVLLIFHFLFFLILLQVNTIACCWSPPNKINEEFNCFKLNFDSKCMNKNEEKKNHFYDSIFIRRHSPQQKQISCSFASLLFVSETKTFSSFFWQKAVKSNWWLRTNWNALTRTHHVDKLIYFCFVMSKAINFTIFNCFLSSMIRMLNFYFIFFLLLLLLLLLLRFFHFLCTKNFMKNNYQF